jgi:predicted GNAT family N-acyltransferase
MVELKGHHIIPEVRMGADLDAQTRKTICKLVVEDGGVPGGLALETALREAKRLALVRLQDRLVAVGAIKKPQRTDLDRISKKSAFDIRGYDAELGYVVVAPQFRRHGLTPLICDALLETFTEPLFATAGSARMKKILSERGFVACGKTWAGREAGPAATLTLFVRSPARAARAS